MNKTTQKEATVVGVRRNNNDITLVVLEGTGCEVHTLDVAACVGYFQGQDYSVTKFDSVEGALRHHRKKYGVGSAGYQFLLRNRPQ